MFYHFLITRFNLKNKDWDLTKNKEALLDDSWMDERIHLFETYCLPSVVNQSNSNFKWLLFFDETTTEKYRQKINELVKNHPNIILFFINGMDAFQDSILQFLAKTA